MLDAEKTGKLIKKLRTSEDLTQADLADKLGVSQKSISKWETGHSLPSADLLIGLSKLFKVSVNELLNGEILSQQEYEEAADRTVIDMMKSSKKSQRLLLGISGALFFCVLLAVVNGLFTGFPFVSYIDIPSIIIMLVSCAGIYFLSFISKKKNATRYVRACVFPVGIFFSLASLQGVLESTAGSALINMLTNAAISLIPLLYACILYVILTIFSMFTD